MFWINVIDFWKYTFFLFFSFPSKREMYLDRDEDIKLKLTCLVVLMEQQILFRYLAISHPSCKTSPMVLTIIIVSIWTISSALATPSIMYSTIVTYHETEDNTATACLMVWPDGPSTESFMDHLYQVDNWFKPVPRIYSIFWLPNNARWWISH